LIRQQTVPRKQIGHWRFVPETIASQQFSTLRYARIAGCDTIIGTCCVYAEEVLAEIRKGFWAAIAEIKKGNWIIPILYRNRRA
jgi:hypothetical protein